jgi:hypothetical protein
MAAAAGRVESLGIRIQDSNSGFDFNGFDFNGEGGIRTLDKSCLL